MIIIGVTKHRHDSTITLYEVENKESRYYCKREQLEKIKL
jgi:hypothetical protein